jgi:hypothetical protein
MWRSKKFIIIAVLTVLVLGGTLGGVAIAQADDQNNSTTPTTTVSANVSSFWDKVADMYKNDTGVTIDPQALQKAITEAKKALCEEALDNYLQKLVSEGKITQDQATQFKTWWDSRPTLPIDEFQQWWNARPDIPGLFGQGNNGMGMIGNMHGIGNFRGVFGGRIFSW